MSKAMLIRMIREKETRYLEHNNESEQKSRWKSTDKTQKKDTPLPEGKGNEEIKNNEGLSETIIDTQETKR